MAKIIKHTFRIPSLIVKDGELIQDKEVTVTYQFTLLFKGIGLYEEIAGKSLLNTLMAVAGEDNTGEALAQMVDKKLIKDLACASYIKIVGDKFHNNRSTAEEFRKSQVYPILENDYDFIMKLLTMAMECVYDDEKSKKRSKGASRPKK